MTREPYCALIGKWRIIEADLWDRDWPMAGSFAQAGMSPHRSIESLRPPSAARTAATSWLGATL